MLIGTLKECNSVVSKLDLSYNQLDDECMKQLGEYIQENEHLELLNIGGRNITDKGVKMLSEYLIGNITLKILKMCTNKGITDASVPYLVEVAKKSCITGIDVQYTSVSEKRRKEIEKVFSTPIDRREIPTKSNTKSAAKKD